MRVRGVRFQAECRAESREIEKPLVVGLRDLAILATLRFTACRAGAVAKLRMGDFQRERGQYVLRFQEKGGKSREIPVRHDPERMILAYIEAAGIGGQAEDSRLFRAGTNGTAKTLTGNPPTSKRICELIKRWLKDAGLPERLSPLSFRASAIADLLTQGVPLEDVQYLAGHAGPRTTGLHDRRQKKVTRDVVGRISLRLSCRVIDRRAKDRYEPIRDLRHDFQHSYYGEIMPLRVYCAILSGRLDRKSPDALDGLQTTIERVDTLLPFIKKGYNWMKTHEKEKPVGPKAIHRIFLAPEYYFSKTASKNDKFFPHDVKQMIVDKLSKAAEDHPDLILIPGTILWIKSEGGEEPRRARHTAYIFLNKRIVKYHKVYHTNENLNETVKTELESASGEGLFQVGKVRYGLEICRDNTKKALKSPVDIHIIVSDYVYVKETAASIAFHSSTKEATPLATSKATEVDKYVDGPFSIYVYDINVDADIGDYTLKGTDLKHGGKG